MNRKSAATIAFLFAPAFLAMKPDARHVLESPKNASATVPLSNSNALATHVEMRNVDFYIDPQVALRVRTLSGTMRSKTGGVVMFDDKSSFIINVESGEVGLTGTDLSLLLNKYVFGYRGSPLRGISVRTSGSEIIERGTLHKVFPMPFEIHAQLSVTPDGRIRIHPVRTEIMGVHVDRLMKGLGIALDEVINLKKAKGAAISGNDIYLTPSAILPPPSVEGRVTDVRVEGDRVVQVFGSASASPSTAIPDNAARNYMFYRGGTLRFGKLEMLDADMQIIDLDPEDPFAFELGRYQPQLVAGYSKTMTDGALTVFMPDRDKIGMLKKRGP